MLAATLLFSATAAAQPNEIVTGPAPVRSIALDQFVPALVRPDYDQSVLVPLHKAQAEEAKALADAEAARVAKAAEDARLAAEAAKVAQTAAPAVSQVAEVSSTSTAGGELFGTIGYALPYGNCVLEPGVNNPGWGNPIDWPVLSQTPTIGATFLFWTNHTGVVTGIWSNGDIEVRHRNFWGDQHRFPRSYFRGFR